MSDSHDPFAEYGDPDFVRSARDPHQPPQPGKEWEHNGRASDIPIEPGDEPSPFTDLPPEEFPDINGMLPEDEPYSNSDIDTQKTTVTFIKDKTGAEMRRADMTLPQLAEHIRFQTAASKMALPWLKLAFFGNQRSDNNSLRTNENVLQITGIEVEHDAGEIAFGTALATILRAGIRCIIYTSPSYVPGVKERWRILLPLSVNYPSEMREKLVARVNGLFAGKLAPESFVLSQAYLYGSINNNPNHRVEVIDGKFLDLRDDLYTGSIFKDGSRVGDQGAGIDLNGAGSQHRSRKDDDPEPVDPGKIEAALNVVSSNCSYAVWLNVAAALRHALGEAGFEMFDRWSAKATGTCDDGTARYTPDKSRERWRGARTMHSITIATLFHYANEADPDWRDRFDRERSAFSGAGAGASSGAGSGPSGSTGPGAQQQSQRTVIRPTPYVWIDPATIPERDWVYGRLLIKKFVTATVAPGGLGKSSLIAAEVLAQVSGKDLLGIIPKERLRVWLWNLEDPHVETQRKIQAVAKHYRLTPEDMGNRLFVDSGRDQPLVIAKTLREGAMIIQPVVDDLVAGIIDKQIDVIVVDPFVSCHEVKENDNNMQDMVVKEWGRVADRGNCAVHLVDHTRKMNGFESEVTTESSRGAKAKTDAARVVRVVNRMTKEEAERTGVQNHRLHFRTYNDKANLAPPADKSDWFELKSVDLGNGPGMEVGGVKFNGPGDSVGVVQVWQWPDPLAGMTGQDFERVAAVIRRGKWRENVQAKAWAGHAVAEALGLDASNKAHRAKIIGMLKVWLAAGSLIVVEGQDENREVKKFIEVREEDA